MLLPTFSCIACRFLKKIVDCRTLLRKSVPNSYSFCFCSWCSSFLKYCSYVLKLFGNTFLDLKILGGGGISDYEFKIQKMAVEEIETAIFLRSKPGNVVKYHYRFNTHGSLQEATLGFAGRVAWNVETIFLSPLTLKFHAMTIHWEQCISSYLNAI